MLVGFDPLVSCRLGVKLANRLNFRDNSQPQDQALSYFFNLQDSRMLFLAISERRTLGKAIKRCAGLEEGNI